jgi:septal ring factor EnvC (AmiA/AmiB activator)
MKGWEIVITDIQFYVGLASILAFGWNLFKFILNARLAILEKEVAQHKDEIATLKADHSKFRDDYHSIDSTTKVMSGTLKHIADGLDTLNKHLEKMEGQVQQNMRDIEGLKH